MSGPRGFSSSGGVDPLLGSVIAGRYRVVERLASGGMGTVYKAEQLGLDRLVALKILDPSQLEGTTQDSRAEDDIAVLEKRFSREAAMLAKLAHPNIVTVFDYGSIEGEGAAHRFYMAMELLGGETLQTRLASKRKLAPDEAIHLGAQIARALREAHAHGIVHRDLKPANVMIVTGRDGEDVVKLLDFGIGKIVDASIPTDDPRAELTQEGRFVGSPLYMSPEQIAHGKVDARTDVYSLGVLLYRCIAGIHPFHRDNTAMVMLAHLNQEPTPLREKIREVPDWLDDVIQRCLIKDPNKRLGSMDELLRAIGEHVTSLSLPSSIPNVRSSPLAIRAMPPAPEAIVEAQRANVAEALTPHSHHATTVTAPPFGEPARPAPKRRSALIFALPALVLVALVIAVVVRVTESTSVANAPSASNGVASSVPSSASAATFSVTFVSKPPHAHVMENGKVLGDTPLTISIERASVTKEARAFTLELEGYQPAKIFQGASDGPITQERELARLVDAPPTPSVTTGPATTGKKFVPPKPSASASVAKPPDINLVR